MGERLGASGNNTSVATDAALQKAFNAFHGEQQSVAGSQLYVGQEAGVNTNVKSDGTVDFAVGARDAQGQAKGTQHAASMVMADTTRDTRAEVRDQAIEASAKSVKHNKLRAFASRIGLAAPLAVGIAAANRLPGVAGAAMYMQRVVGRVIDNVANRSMEKKLINERDMDTSARYQDSISRLSQEVNIDGDNIALLNEGETRREAQNEQEASLEQAVRDQLGAYWESTSTIPPSMKSMSKDRAFQLKHGINRMSKKERGAWYDKYQTDFRTERTNPEYQAAKRAELEQNLAAAVEEYNTTIHKKDGSRGMFSANNFMQFADAGKNALELGASAANVRNGFDKVNMVFAEVASPVPEERLGRLEKAANALHNASRGLISVDSIGVALTATAGIAAGTGQFGTTMAARTIPIFGVAITAGAFSAFSEASRTKKERSRASRKVAYGREGEVGAEMKDTLMETKTSAEVVRGFGDQLAVLQDALTNKNGHLTAHERSTILSQMAGFDQRLQAQVESGTPLFSYSSREKSDSEFWDMRRRRGILQNLLAQADARQKTAANSPDFDTTLAASREKVRDELAAYNAEYLGSEASQIDTERTRANQAFSKLRNWRVAKVALKTSLFVGAASALGPFFGRVFGAGTPLARAATALGMGALFTPRFVKDAKQIIKADKNQKLNPEEMEKELLRQFNKKKTKLNPEDEARFQELGRKFMTERGHEMADGTAQVDGARPHSEELVAVEAPAPIGETADSPEAEAGNAEEIADADANLIIQELKRLEEARKEQDRRDRAITRTKEILQGSGLPIPSDEDLNAAFNRTVNVLSASRSQAA